MRDSMKALIITRDDRKLINSIKPSAYHKICGLTPIELVLRKLSELNIKKEIVFLSEEVDAFDKLNQKYAIDEICKKYDTSIFDRTATIDESYLIVDASMANIDSSVINELTVEDVEVKIITSSNEAVIYNTDKIYQLGMDPATTLFKNMKTDFSDLDSDICELVEIYETKNIDAPNSEQMIVLNNMVDLYHLRRAVNNTKLFDLMNSGVIIHDINNTYVDYDVEVGSDTEVFPNSILEGNTIVGNSCSIGPGARIKNSIIKNDITIKDSTITESKVDDNTNVGPYAYLRPKSDIGKNVKIGDFVEVKNARISDNSKVSHLSYVGDGHVGENVNIGCGVVFSNYDGKVKSKTIVEDNAFVGCNVNLVAPVTVKKGAYIAAGSTITDEVPEEALGIARCRQTNKLEWAKGK